MSRIVDTGTTSIAKTVRDVTNDCIFTFVDVDHLLRPQRVPRVFPASYDEGTRYLAAYRRNRRAAEYESAALATCRPERGRS